MLSSMRLTASVLDGLVDADPIVVGIMIGVVIALSVAFVVLRIRRRSRTR
jgi:hypothetical protein